MKLEPKTRTVLREVFQRNITGLIKVINDIATAIYSQQQKYPLILIDDLDKPLLDKAREIFFDRREIMLQPHCAIVYTVSSALFYSPEFEAIRDNSIFLPNIKLYHRTPKLRTQPANSTRDEEGFTTMRQCVQQRMASQLITSEALDCAIQYSGGVFRELARLMRGAIGRTRRNKAKQIEKSAMESAASDIRSEYRRLLDSEDLLFLNERRQDNQLYNHPRLRPLLQLLALLEYRNGENWCAVHPTLEVLLAELTPDDWKKLLDDAQATEQRIGS